MYYVSPSISVCVQYHNNIYSNSNSWDIIIYSDISVMFLPWRYDGNSKEEKRKTLDK